MSLGVTTMGLLDCTLPPAWKLCEPIPDSEVNAALTSLVRADAPQLYGWYDFALGPSDLLIFTCKVCGDRREVTYCPNCQEGCNCEECSRPDAAVSAVIRQHRNHHRRQAEHIIRSNLVALPPPYIAAIQEYGVSVPRGFRSIAERLCAPRVYPLLLRAFLPIAELQWAFKQAANDVDFVDAVTALEDISDGINVFVRQQYNASTP